jgi:small subunit ribosomal protein S17
MDKTVVVEVETPKRHPLYKKTIRRKVKFKAHDENKRWRVGEIITKGEVVEVQPEEII